MINDIPRALLRWSILTCGVLTLNACTTLGPDYQEPGVEWLSDWQASTYPQATKSDGQGEADLRFCWQRFGDPVLNRLIDTAK